MDARYDLAQDLTLTLNWDERVLLLDRKTRHFYDNSLQGVFPELKAWVYLAYSFDDEHLLVKVENIEDGLGQILIPSANLPRRPLLVNLSDRGIEFLKDGWPHGVRYDGSHKLFIFGGESKHAVD